MINDIMCVIFNHALFETLVYSKLAKLSADSRLLHLAAPLTLRRVGRFSSVALRRRLSPVLPFNLFLHRSRTEPIAGF
jgi:hypothetical protein